MPIQRPRKKVTIAQTVDRAIPPAAPQAGTGAPGQTFPRMLRHSTQRPDVVYELASDLYATRAAASASREAAVLTVDGDAGEQYRVYRGEPVQSRSTAGAPPVYPVYAQGPGRMVIPTGRLLVRFADAISAESRAADLTQAGYRIAQSLSYAPNAAWIEATGSGVDAALNNIERVENLPDVQNVEPQLVAPRMSKT